MPVIPSLDVIVLTYNRAGLFEKTLRSVCDQTYPDFTVKVLNNGSTDNTEEVFNKVKAEYPQRRFDYLKLSENHIDQYFIDRKNEFITADYVIVFHDDDLMHPRYVEHLMKIIPEHPEFVILGGRTKPSENPEELKWDEPTGKYIVGDVRDMVKWYFMGDTFSFPAICYKSVWYKNAEFRDDLYGKIGDFPFLMDIAEHGKVCRLEDRFLHYRCHKGQNSFILPSPEKRKNLIKKMADVLLNGDKEYQDVFYRGIENIFIPNGYIDYKTAILNGWLLLPEKISGKKTKTYKIHLFKSYLYRLLSHISPKKGLYFYEKAERHRLKSKSRIKVCADKSNEIRINKATYSDITVNVKGKNNKIVICSADGTGDISIDVKGNNNTVFIGKTLNPGQIAVGVYCSDGKIEIPHIDVIKNLTLINGDKENCAKITGGCVRIGEGSNILDASITNPHSDTYISIGKKCMFSSGISVRNTDGHPIYDIETKQCLNKVGAGNGIDIGDHVWIGMGVTILKNAAVPNDSIVGTQTVVTKRFSEPNVILAGNPAKIIRRNITWAVENGDFLAPAKGAEQ